MSNLTLKTVDPDQPNLYIVEYTATHLRYLLSGGEVYDVMAIADDVELRSQLRGLSDREKRTIEGRTIEGVTVVNRDIGVGTFRFVGKVLTDEDRAVLEAADEWENAVDWDDPPTGNDYEMRVARAETALSAAVRARREAQR